jgi:molybdopterin adenylyltransferase
MFRYAIIIASDKGSTGQRIDGCIPVIKDTLPSLQYQLMEAIILPDDQTVLSDHMIRMSDILNVDLILTSGGTGFSIRDVTPEATKSVIHKEVPGFGEAMRMMSMAITNKAMLSRATAGIRNQTLIINLPGSPRAVKECLEFILKPLEHGLEIMIGSASECARTE